MIDDIKRVSKQCKYVEELYDIPWKIMSDQSIPKKIQETRIIVFWRRRLSL